MNNFVLNIMNKYGYLGILFLITIENIFPPIPSEVILTLGGYMSTKNGINMSTFGVIIYSTIGSLLGAIILYYIGFIFNKDNLIKLSNKKIGKIIGLKEKNIVKSLDRFNEYGYLTVLYSRFIPIIRSLISIPAGIYKMNIVLFLIYTIIGSFIWNSILVILGKVVGNNYMFVASVFSKYSKLIIIILIVLILFKIFKKKS